MDRISLQYTPNANEMKNERMLHMNDTKNARYTKRTHEMKRTNYTENAN